MEPLTKEKLAEMLSGRELGEEITEAEEEAAKAAGLVVVFGYSDDCTEFRGAIYDEFGLDPICFVKGYPVSETELEEDEEVFKKYGQSIPKGKQIKPQWHEVEDEEGNIIDWTFKTDIPHATFNIYEEGGLHCRGIVFALEDAK